MGLDLEFVVGDIDEELVCKICKSLVMDPVSNSNCRHIFCKSCVEERLEISSNKFCPLCMSKLSFDLVSPPSAFLLKLLDVRVQCKQKCGTVCKIEELPDHITEICPNTPTSCPNAKASKPGCKMQVKRCELEEHIKECDYRTVSCEACGYKTVYWNLFTHQSRKRCLEKKLRQYLIKGSRNTENEVRRHKDAVQKDHNKIELEQRKRVVQQALAIQKQSRLRKSRSISVDHLNSRDQLPDNKTLFLTENTTEDEPDKCDGKTWPTFKSESRMRNAHKREQHFYKCDRCGQKYEASENKPTSCRWHHGVSFNS